MRGFLTDGSCASVAFTVRHVFGGRTSGTEQATRDGHLKPLLSTNANIYKDFCRSQCGMNFVKCLKSIVSPSFFDIMYISKGLLCSTFTCICSLVYASAIPLTKTLSTRAAFNSSATYAMPLADPRGVGFKNNVLNGLWRAQRYAQTQTEIKVLSVRNRVVDRPSSNLVDFKRIALDVIVPDYFKAPGVFDVATLDGDLTWGIWLAHLTSFRPFDVRRFDITFTRNDVAGIFDQDEALARLAALGVPGT